MPVQMRLGLIEYLVLRPQSIFYVSKLRFNRAIWEAYGLRRGSYGSETPRSYA
jgi:hypothetical protein